jgi:hypothetical protein
VKYVLIFILAVAGLFLLSLWSAQCAVWGLSLFHVDSGIWGPFFLIGVLESAIVTGVAFGRRSAS